MTNHIKKPLQSSNAAQEDTAWERSCAVFFSKKRKIVKSGSFFNFLSGNIIECVFLSCKSVSVVTVKLFWVTVIYENKVGA